MFRNRDVVYNTLMKLSWKCEIVPQFSKLSNHLQCSTRELTIRRCACVCLLSSYSNLASALNNQRGWDSCGQGCQQWGISPVWGGGRIMLNGGMEETWLKWGKMKCLFIYCATKLLKRASPFDASWQTNGHCRHSLIITWYWQLCPSGLCDPMIQPQSKYKTSLGLMVKSISLLFFTFLALHAWRNADSYF